MLIEIEFCRAENNQRTMLYASPFTAKPNQNEYKWFTDTVVNSTKDGVAYLQLPAIGSGQNLSSYIGTNIYFSLGS